MSRKRPATTSPALPNKKQKLSASPKKAPQKIWIAGRERRIRKTCGCPFVTADGMVAPGSKKAVTPPWSTLPYEILLDIFTVAYDKQKQVCSHGSPAAWAASTALVCKSFTEPALTALYRAPQFGSATSLRRFFRTISQPGSLNYGMKVRHLVLQLDQLVKVPKDFGRIDLLAQMKHMPMLSSLKMLPIREAGARGAISTRIRPNLALSGLLAEMGGAGIRLKAWEWGWQRYVWIKNGTWASEVDYARQSLSLLFQHLQHLELDGTLDCIQSVSFGQIVQPLQRLRSIRLDHVGSELADLLQLPDSLRSISLCNIELSQDVFQEFLQTRGHQLEELTLEHTRTDHSFLSTLSSTCPRLELLQLKHYPMTSVTRGLTPPATGKSFEWPLTLQSLVISESFDLPANIATALFESLLEAGPMLPDLRHLTVKVSVDLEWRQRAIFRSTWIPKMKQMFDVGPRTPPSLHLASIPAFRAWQAAQKSSFETKRAKGPRRSETDNKVKQGRCEVVHISVDNSRPMFETFGERDFLDSSADDDSDYGN